MLFRSQFFDAAALWQNRDDVGELGVENMLFSFGTGPVKGFAVTLSIGILTSMFTAIMGTRALINLIYGGKRLQKLSI